MSGKYGKIEKNGICMRASASKRLIRRELWIWPLGIIAAVSLIRISGMMSLVAYSHNRHTAYETKDAIINQFAFISTSALIKDEKNVTFVEQIDRVP